MCRISIAKLLAKFEEKYDLGDRAAGYDEAVEEFDSYVKDHAAFVRKFIEYRDDYISSDREAAAFMLALHEIKEGRSNEE